MKRQSILFLTLLMIHISVVGQEAKKEGDIRKTIFGLKATSNFSWFDADSRNLEKGGLKLGFGYGLMGDYNLSDKYAASFEFLVTKLNGKILFKDSLTYVKDGIEQKKSFDVEYAYSNRYIQLPVSIKFRTKEIGYIKYFAQFGIAPAVRITSKVLISGHRMPWPDDDLKGIKTNDAAEDAFQPREFEDDVRLLHLPLIIGGGVEYNLSDNTSIYLCLRYENGFTNILKDNNTTAFGKNIGLSLGVFF